MAIIVGVDGSEHALRAFRWAIGEGRLRGQDVVAVLAYSQPPAYYPYGIPGAGNSRLVEELKRGAEEQLAKAYQEVEPLAAGVNVTTEAVEHHQPARALTERAGRDDILVVGSRGHGGFAGLLLGSVSQQCAQHAVCPVVVLPPEES